MTNVPEPQIPNPNGAPVPSQLPRKSKTSPLTKGLAIVVGGVTAFVALSTIATPTMGAARSQRVTWEQRRAEIAQAQAQSDGQSDNAAMPQPGAPGHD
jgi:hypothetical protein